ncbi:MAG: serine hydrolase [bacterium]|jgi:D-alanyl-D-alanine carboxypeptidase|nr:serine hydrolase [bacterium]
MDNDNLKFLFVFIMVSLAFISKLDRNNLEKTFVQENAKGISLTASARPVLSNKNFSNYAQQSNTSLDIQLQSLSPYRKDWNLPDPILEVKAAIAQDLDSELIFYQYNTYERWPLASLTKLMSAVITIESVGLDKQVIISPSAVATEGFSGNLEVGEEYKVSDLLKAMLVVSSNDAATAVAEFYGLDNFLNQMNAKALELGMMQTSFSDPTGLSYLNQGTIEDLSKLVRYIYKNHPEIFQITANVKVSIFEETKKILKELTNINNFTARPEFFGGKSGFTDQAKSNLITLFNYQGHKILLVVLGTHDRFGQTDLLYNWVKNTFVFN